MHLFRIIFSRAGNSIIGFLCESLIFCDGKSDLLVKKSESLSSLFFKDWRDQFAHSPSFVKSYGEQFPHGRPFVKSDESESIPSIFNKEQLSKNLQKIWFFLANRLRGICSRLLFCKVTRAIWSHALFFLKRRDQFAHDHFFLKSGESKSLTVASFLKIDESLSSLRSKERIPNSDKLSVTSITF